MTEKKDRGILSGSLWKAILVFAIPIALSNMLQQLFNTADVAVVGRFAGKEALAAVGSNGSIINLLLNLFVGLSVGANVVIARFIGEGDDERVGRAAHTAIVVSVISGVIVMILGLILARPMLVMMSSPEDVIDLATLYLRIYFLGMPFMMLYNFSSAILRSRGDTKRPLICLSVSGVINLILNLVLVIVFDLSVAGVAIATVIANMVSSAMMVYFLMHEKGPLKISLNKLCIDKRILLDFVRIGMPAGLQGAVFSISNVSVQSSLNSLGSDFVAGSSAALNFEFYVYHLASGFSQATVTFVGQNYGAGNNRRCRDATKWSVLLALISGGVLIGAMLLFRNSMVYVFTEEALVAQIAATRMLFILPFILVNNVSDILSGSMRGMGHSLVPALITILGVCGVRFLYIYTVFEKMPTFEVLMSVYPISWIITFIGIFSAYLMVRKHMKVK